MRLIDVDKFEEKNAKVWRQFGRESSYYAVGYILSQASVDAVPVIRCKDCRFYKEENLQCMMHEGDNEEWYDNDYCSLAERKEE